MSKIRKAKVRTQIYAVFILSILALSVVLVFATDFDEYIITSFGGAEVINTTNSTELITEDFGGAEVVNTINSTELITEDFGGAMVYNTRNETTLLDSGSVGGFFTTSGWNVTEVPICTTYGHGDIDNGYSVDVFSYWYCNDVNLDGYIFSHNATGSFVNATWTSFDSPFNNTWANVSIPLDNDLGDTVVYYFYANSTSGKWNITPYSGSFTVTATITFVKSAGCDMLKDGGNIANGTQIVYSAPDTLNMTADVSEGYLFDYWAWYAGTETDTNESFDFVVDYTTTLYLYVVPEAPTVPDEEPIIPPYGSDYTTQDFYFHGYAFEVNNVTGYALMTTPPNDGSSQQISTSGSATVSWGARVWVLYADGTEELTSGTPVVIGTLDGENESMLTQSFTIDETVLTFGHGALQINIYSRWDSGSWSTRGIWVSDYLYYSKIAECNATLSLYANRTENLGNTYSTIYWGETPYIGGLDDVVFKNARSYDWQQYYLTQGNLVSFITAPYVVVLGNGIYALGLFGLGMSIYIRYRQFSILALFIILLSSGAGGVINLVIGETFIGAVWLVAVFGIALIYWRVFR